jgi:hypothetical protein
MDNGVIRISKSLQNGKAREFKDISSSTVKGHAWSMMYFNKTLYAIFAPWNKSNDFLLKYSETEKTLTSDKLTDYSSRTTRGTFWGKAYSRKLAFFYGILSFRDGANGGIVKTEPNALNGPATFSFGEFNKVYNAVEEFNGLLYVATCEGPPTAIALNQSLEGEFSIRFPSGFCAFTTYKDEQYLYFLGSQRGRSVIYKLIGNRVVKFADMKLGSAFYSMFINPLNRSQIAISTITWSKRGNSGLYISNDAGGSFVEQSCLLTHFNGVSAIRFDLSSNLVYVLQKVGGLLSIPVETLFSSSVCNKND